MILSLTTRKMMMINRLREILEIRKIKSQDLKFLFALPFLISQKSNSNARLQILKRHLKILDSERQLSINQVIIIYSIEDDIIKHIIYLCLLGGEW